MKGTSDEIVSLFRKAERQIRSGTIETAHIAPKIAALREVVATFAAAEDDPTIRVRYIDYHAELCR